MSNGQSVVKEASDFENGHDGYFDFNTQSMDYDFYAVPSGSGLDIEDPTKPDASWKEDATGTQTVTYTVSDLTGYWTGLGYIVPDPAPTAQYEYTIAAAPVLTSLSVSPSSFVNTQYAGEEPDFTGLTFTAGYSDGSSTTVGSQYLLYETGSGGEDYWDASGNPNNLGTQNITLTYLDDQEEASTSINGTIIHRPDDAGEMPTNTENWVYWDFLEDWVGDDHGTPTNLIISPMEILQEGASQGDIIMGMFVGSDYTNDVTVDGTALTGYIQTYGVVPQDNDEDPNTSAYKPGTGYNFSVESNQRSLAFHVDGTKPVSDSVVLHVAIGPAVANIAAGVGVKRTDIDTTSAVYKHYTVTCVPS